MSRLDVLGSGNAGEPGLTYFGERDSRGVISVLEDEVSRDIAAEGERDFSTMTGIGQG